MVSKHSHHQWATNRTVGVFILGRKAKKKKKKVILGREPNRLWVERSGKNENFEEALKLGKMIKLTPSRLVLLHNGIANDDKPICSPIKHEQLNIHFLYGFSTCLRLITFFLIKQKRWIHQIMDANYHNSTKQIPVWFASIRVHNYKPDRHSMHAWDNWDS